MLVSVQIILYYIHLFHYDLFTALAVVVVLIIAVLAVMIGMLIVHVLRRRSKAFLYVHR